ncbi:hypothetical protein F383_08527 [Gossypium arboreum]|uniref:Uncharacterized protein n=1 Tax=Gossypium arboreum TaxID=29729 RepID=A0A0B0NBR8_GOSAR|nr:hypothetical protein F383_08527 [Gossypium arboreum]
MHVLLLRTERALLDEVQFSKPKSHPHILYYQPRTRSGPMTVERCIESTHNPQQNSLHCSLVPDLKTQGKILPLRFSCI